MGRDNHPQVRQQRQLARKLGTRPGYPRILIVCEGKKTEPGYFSEIQEEQRLNTAYVQILPSQLGTSPLRVVESAEELFRSGDPHKRIRKRSFEQVFAVFDRDDHESYFDALTKAAQLDGKLRNDVREAVVFRAIASVPCFELWLLLHYEEIGHAIHRDEVLRRLKRHIPSYEKGKSGYFALTKSRLPEALQRAEKLMKQHSAHEGCEPYTDLGILVQLMTTMKR
jgi:hypothetical protein